MSSYRYTVPKLERVTKAIGYVCVYWAWLEDEIADMILDLAPFDKRTIPPKQLEQLRDVILLDSDIRTKIKILRTVAFVRKMNNAWFTKVDKVLQKIDNDLRPKRNRIVHDQWYSPKRGLERRSRQAKLRRPQSFADLELITQERVNVKLREVWNLSKSLISVQFRLAKLSLDYDAFEKEVGKELDKIDVEAHSKQAVQMFAKDAIEGGPLLNSLLAIYLKRHPHQASVDNRPTTPSAKRPPPQRSSRKKPPPKG